jgi:hypothetical protein
MVSACNGHRLVVLHESFHFMTHAPTEGPEIPTFTSLLDATSMHADPHFDSTIEDATFERSRASPIIFVRNPTPYLLT